jgi:hypothetical protein
MQRPPRELKGGVRLNGRRTPNDLAAAKEVRARRRAIVDYERAVRASPDVLQRAVAPISSVGLGVRIAYRKTSPNLRLDCGFRLTNGTPGVRDRGRANFSLAWVLLVLVAREAWRGRSEGRIGPGLARVVVKSS